MQKTNRSRMVKRPANRAIAPRRVRARTSSSWFFHPEMQARIAEAEADLRDGRTHRTDSADSAQRLLDSWKK